MAEIDKPLPNTKTTVEVPGEVEIQEAIKENVEEVETKGGPVEVEMTEEDGAEVITFGCSALFWLKPFVRHGLLELGWDVPILEGYSCAIELAKSMVNLDIDQCILINQN